MIQYILFIMTNLQTIANKTKFEILFIWNIYN